MNSKAHVESAKYEKPPKGWCYLTTACNDFQLTAEQVREGIKRGLIQCRRVVNPHRPTGPKSTIVERKQVLQMLIELRALPKITSSLQIQRNVSHSKHPALERRRPVVISEDKVTVPYREAVSTAR